MTPASVVLADDDEPPTAILLSAVPDRIAEGEGSRRVEVTAEFDRGALAEATAVVVSVAETVGGGGGGLRRVGNGVHDHDRGGSAERRRDVFR